MIASELLEVFGWSCLWKPLPSIQSTIPDASMSYKDPDEQLWLDDDIS